MDGLSQLAVADYTTIDTLIKAGNTVRKTTATLMNDTSSRSHAVFTIVLTQVYSHVIRVFCTHNTNPVKARYDEASKSTGTKVSRVCLVDLAGSERHSKSGTSGTALREGSSINQSLSTLGSVIHSLVESQSDVKAGKFIPYRDSTLTWLLKDNLGGNARTTMIATISPVLTNYEETLSTLR